jgi:gamma-glutamyl hercynylcysteine S-oxide synthase
LAVVLLLAGGCRTPGLSRKTNPGQDRLGHMVTIPAGRFVMGNNSGAPEERPEHEVYLAAYQIGKYEVTRGEYRRFMEAGGYDDPQYWSAEGWQWKESDVIDHAGMYGQTTHTRRPNLQNKRREPEHWAAEQSWVGHGYGHPRFIQTDQHPVVGVTYYEAEAYCKWAGGRLPTEAEYEKAARWDEKKQHSNIWPWGDTWDSERSNNPDDHNSAGGGYRVNQSAPVGSYPAGASPYGCLDMAGNAYEWVADWAKSYPGDPKPYDFTDKYRLVKGGCWDDPRANCSYRSWYLAPSCSGTGPGDSDYIGFRVARQGVRMNEGTSTVRNRRQRDSRPSRRNPSAWANAVASGCSVQRLVR